MKLYFGANSPYARKVRVVLAELGVDYEPASIDVNKPPTEFNNPNLRVPCLEDQGRVLFESNVIVDYLLQTYGSGSGNGGKPPLARTLTRPDHHWDDVLTLTAIETVLDSGLNIFQFKRAGIGADQVPYLKREDDRIQSDLDWLEGRIGPDGFAPGTLSIQDLNLCITLMWLDFRKPAAWRGRPKLEALVARHEERPALAATRPAG